VARGCEKKNLHADYRWGAGGLPQKRRLFSVEGEGGDSEDYTIRFANIRKKIHRVSIDQEVRRV